MSTATTIEPVVPTAATAPTTANSFSSRLAPPFDPNLGWTAFKGPEPPGYFCSVMLDSYRGTQWVEMGAKLHPSGSPLTIGWCWWGWRRKVFLYPGYLSAVFHAQNVMVNHNGGNWVPWCTIGIQKQTQRPDEPIISDEQKLFRQTTTTVRVRVPELGVYELTVGGFVRAVYKGSAMPYGKLDATVQGVFFDYILHPAEPLARDQQIDAEAHGPSILVDPNEATAEELQRQLATLGSGITTYPLGSLEEIRSAGLVTI